MTPLFIPPNVAEKWLLRCYIVAIECEESSGLHMFNDVEIELLNSDNQIILHVQIIVYTSCIKFCMLTSSI